jgi:hypothetical protein
VQVFEFICGLQLFSRKHPTIEANNFHVAQIIKFAGEEFPPDLIKTYKLASSFLDMETGMSDLLQRLPVLMNSISITRLFCGLPQTHSENSLFPSLQT